MVRIILTKPPIKIIQKLCLGTTFLLLLAPQSVHAFFLSDAFIGLLTPVVQAYDPPEPVYPSSCSQMFVCATSFVQVPWPSYELKDPPSWTWKSCVESAKWMTGRQGQSWGIAGDIAADTEDPLEARYLLTNEGPVGHMVVIASQDADWWYTRECNGLLAGQCNSRTISKEAAYIRGFKK